MPYLSKTGRLIYRAGLRGQLLGAFSRRFFSGNGAKNRETELLPDSLRNKRSRWSYRENIQQGNTISGFPGAGTLMRSRHASRAARLFILSGTPHPKKAARQTLTA
ncbi:MAG: hypothetical protein IKM45_06760 [Opitutales bacterium]|nr:hypothetical protein [Opitutales bacterium]